MSFHERLCCSYLDKVVKIQKDHTQLLRAMQGGSLTPRPVLLPKTPKSQVRRGGQERGDPPPARRAPEGHLQEPRLSPGLSPGRGPNGARPTHRGTGPLEGPATLHALGGGLRQSSPRAALPGYQAPAGRLCSTFPPQHTAVPPGTPTPYSPTALQGCGQPEPCSRNKSHFTPNVFQWPNAAQTGRDPGLSPERLRALTFLRGLLPPRSTVLF